MDRFSPTLLVFIGAGLGGVVRHALNNGDPESLRRRLSLGDADHQCHRLDADGPARRLARFPAAAGWSQHLRLFAATGILGGYTTFSTFSLERCC